MTQALPQPNQALRHSVSFTADQHGAATFTFPGASPYWTGSVNVVGAPIAAIFNPTVADIAWGNWSGPSASPTLQIPDQQVLTITATGLLPYATYVAQLVAASQDAAHAPTTWPGAALAVPPFATMALVSKQGEKLAPGADTFYPIGVGGPGTGGTFDCRGWGAIRVGIIVLSATVMEFDFIWRDSANLNNAIRTFIVPASGAIEMVLPHLGDTLQIQAFNEDGAATANYQISLSQTSEAITAWAALNSAAANGFDALLLVASAAFTGTHVLGNTLDTYAGEIGVYGDFSTFTAWACHLQWQDDSLNWHTLTQWTQNTTTGGTIRDRVLVPPTPLRIQGVNGDGATSHTATVSLVANFTIG